jgi:hypothetical protein
MASGIETVTEIECPHVTYMDRFFCDDTKSSVTNCTLKTNYKCVSENEEVTDNQIWIHSLIHIMYSFFQKLHLYSYNINI